jgi:aspartate aminotransferase
MSNSKLVFILGNHESILQTVGFEVRKYRYWNKEKLGLDIDGLIADLEAAPEKSVILLHACAVSILQCRTMINFFFLLLLLFLLA